MTRSDVAYVLARHIRDAALERARGEAGDLTGRGSKGAVGSTPEPPPTAPRRSRSTMPAATSTSPSTEEGIDMFEARRAVARALLKVLAATGPIQLNAEEKAYFASLLPDPPETLSGAEVTRRLDSVTPVTVRRLPID